MSDTSIEFQQIVTLKAFYDLMARTRELRSSVVGDLHEGRRIDEVDVRSLRNALESLEAIPGAGMRRRLALGADRDIEVDLDYEITELERDLLYLERGEEALLRHLEEIHPDFARHVDAGVTLLEGKQFNAFITDRDGTINNYCGRYRSSVQSIYNAVWLTRFAQRRAEHAIIITSAPLRDPGIVDVSVNPERTIIYAASKGREFLDLTGTRRSYEVAPEKARILARLNEEVKALMARPEYEVFGLIGSGLQFKFGQTTVARQDISQSIPADASQAFMEELTDIVTALDPDGNDFRIEDTSLDVEIILTIEGREGLKDFDKADSVDFLADALGLEMARGPHLVCGDTASDVPMVEATMAHSPDTYAIFVTTDDELADRVTYACPRALIVPTPDVLVATLNALAR